MEGAEAQTGLSPEDTALTLANSAAQLCNAPALRAKALLLAGQCLQYKYFQAVPKPLHPWPPRAVGHLTSSWDALEFACICNTPVLVFFKT